MVLLPFERYPRSLKAELPLIRLSHKTGPPLTAVNPLNYDSGFAEISTYQKIVRSLHCYTANVVSTTKIVPVIPSYSSSPWHRPNVENIGTATSALAMPLATGSRVNGAGIGWWYGFFYDEDGGQDASGERALTHDHPSVFALSANTSLVSACILPRDRAGR
jgi:hypothetical protein